mmetsp:Transcript_25198/g.61115  ORF Transcript_25198/g.61115 Transcript_25198/m.61115 type:complete len:270 (-) Transcript_25198:219-1028(-)
MLMSPRMCVPFARFFSMPPRSWRRSPFLTYSWPWIDGARDSAIFPKASPALLTSLMLTMSFSVMALCVFSLARLLTATPMTAVRNTPSVCPSPLPARGLYTPTTSMRSPGLATSTRSLVTSTSTERGSCPTSVFSGISWRCSPCESVYSHRPYSVVRRLPSSSRVMYVLPVGRPPKLDASRYSRWCSCCVFSQKCTLLSTFGLTREHFVTMPWTQTSLLMRAALRERGVTWFVPKLPVKPTAKCALFSAPYSGLMAWTVSARALSKAGR